MVYKRPGGELMWSLITVTYNSASKLREFWSDVELGPGVEWIVVDNGSSDDSCAVASELGARVIRAGGNVGFSKANNIGTRNAAGEYILFANPDLRVMTRDLPVLESILDAHGGLVSPLLLFPDGEYQHNGRGWPFLSWKLRNRLSSSGAGKEYLPNAGGNPYMPVAWLTGASVAARRADIESLGGWDESYFLYNEDVALGMTARRHGLNVGVATEVSWIHGWAREPAQWRFKPVLRELASTVGFYRREPVFLLPPWPIWRVFLDNSLRRSFHMALEPYEAEPNV